MIIIGINYIMANWPKLDIIIILMFLILVPRRIIYYIYTFCPVSVEILYRASP